MQMMSCHLRLMFLGPFTQEVSLVLPEVVLFCFFTGYLNKQVEDMGNVFSAYMLLEEIAVQY